MWFNDKPKHDHKKPQLLDYWMKDAEVDKIRVNTSNIFLKNKYTKINNYSSSVLSKSKKINL